MALLEYLLRVGGQRRSQVGGWLLASALIALLPTSCLTPDFDFSERGIGEGGSGPQVEHCQNRAKDADEADVDCGGIDCAPCALGRDCRVDGDCVNDSCTGGRCQAPTCIDTERNGSETDIDCGGQDCAPCESGKKCASRTDCDSEICTSGTCAAASCTDRVQNGDEVDVDCGGPCDGCAPGESCMFDGDCMAPPEDDPADVECSEGQCTLVCPLGTADCNQRASDGCEANLNVDALHCGGCGEVCDPDNAVQGICQSGVCLIDFENGGCVEGFDDCDNDPENGCETNLGTDPLHCGTCGEACSDANGEASCSGGLCAIDCVGDYADCDDDARSNGCESDISSDTKHCGGCGDACPTGGSTESPFCVDRECGLTDCPEGFGDCDGNGTCTDSLSTTTNCGTCGTSCAAANATAVCSDPGDGYACSIGACSTGGGKDWEDCDGNYLNGCEVDVLSSTARCGGCLPGDLNAGSGVDCNTLKNNASLRIAAITCASGGCRVTACNAGYADCDGDPTNGCEVNTTSNTNSCGGCLPTDPNPGAGNGVNCAALWDNASGTCVDSLCQFSACHANYGNCSAGLADGCETDLRSTEAHCGDCGITCLTPTGTSSNSCNSGLCNPACAAPSSQWQNCDGNGANGCENKLTNEQHCGSCGIVCTTPTGTSSNSCSSGTCVPTCGSSYLSCDGNGANGCEVNRLTNEDHCGSCGNACETNAGTTANTCSTGSCSPSCHANYLNCDGNGANGCETNRTNDEDNCGACGRVCGGSAQTDVASASCNSSTCSVTCSAGLCPDTSDPERKCTAPLGTTSNCSTCGEVCSGATPYCTPQGCSSYLPIAVVNEGTSAVSSSTDLGFAHELQTSAAANAYRAVVLLLGDKANPNGLPPNVTYAGEPMTLVVDRFDNQAWSGLYYILGADLPSAAGSQTVLVPGASGNPQRWAARVVELINVNQAAPVIDAEFVSQGGSTCGTAAATLSLTTSVDAWIGSVLTESRVLGEDPAPTGSNLSAFTVLTTPESTVSQGSAFATGTSRNVSWVGCSAQAWSHVAAAFRPQGQTP